MAIKTLMMMTRRKKNRMKPSAMKGALLPVPTAEG